jgi:hypothetical protein
MTKTNQVQNMSHISTTATHTRAIEYVILPHPSQL